MKKQGRHPRNECYSGGSENRSFREDGRLLQVFTEMGSEKLGQIRQILDRNRSSRRNGSQPIFQKHEETGTECGQIIGGSTAQKSAGIKLLPSVPFNSPAASSNSTSSQLDSSDKMSSSSCSNESSASYNAREYLNYGVYHGKLVDSTNSCSSRQAHRRSGSFSNWSSYSQVLESSSLTQKFDQEDDSVKLPFAVRKTVLNSGKQDSNQRYDSCDTLQEKLLDGSNRQHQRSCSFSSYSQSQLNLPQEFDLEDDSVKQPFISAKHPDERNQNSCHRDDLSDCIPSHSSFKSGGFSVYPGWFTSMSPCDSVAVAYQYQPLDSGFKTRHLPRRRQNSISNHHRLPSNHRVDIEMPDSTSQPELRKHRSSFKKHQRTKSASSFGPSHHSEIKDGQCTNPVPHVKRTTKIQVMQTGQLFGRQKSSIKEMSKSLSRLGSMQLSDHSKEVISRKVSFRPKQKGYSRSKSLTPSRLGSPQLSDQSRELTKMSFSLKSSLADYVPESAVRACLEFDPILGYRFWLDEQDEMLIARDCTEISEANAKTTLVFYSWKPAACSNWKKEKGRVKVVAKMEIRNKIRPEIVADGEIAHYIDLEFKLLDSRPDENVQQKVPLSSTEKVLNRISKLYHRSSSCPSSPTLKKSCDGMETSETKTTCNGSLYCSPLKLRRERKSIDFDDFWDNPTVKSSKQIMSFESNVELAAVLISMPIYSRMQDWENMARTLGWGMSFLRSKNNADGSSPSESEELEERNIKVNTTRHRRGKSVKSSGKQQNGNQKVQMNVILAAGRHGCPSHGLAGPEPLLTRWKSGGKCDCGSWDLGCGLHILGGDIQSTNNSCSELLKIYTEDKEHQENIMKLSSTENGQFSVDFQSPMSSIQAFAIAISTIRTIFRATSPTRKRMEEPRRRGMQSSNHRLFENSNSASVAEDHFKDVSGSLKKLRRAYTLGCHAPSQIERV